MQSSVIPHLVLFVFFFLQIPRNKIWERFNFELGEFWSKY